MVDIQITPHVLHAVVKMYSMDYVFILGTESTYLFACIYIAFTKNSPFIALCMGTLLNHNVYTHTHRDR